jgi:acetyl-CoA C-acetyltransferase
MITDGLWDSFSDSHMGALTDRLTRESGIAREDLDAYVLRSFDRANAAWATGALDVFEFNGVAQDQILAKLVREKVPLLRPCFRADGLLTAASSSAIADGAAGVVVASAEFAAAHNLPALARVVAYGEGGCDPAVFPTATVGAARSALRKAGLDAGQIDLWEVNEAFATVPLYFAREMGISLDIVNVLGGALAIGHPLGCTGIRLINTLLSALRINEKKWGLATLCNGGGGAVAVIIELI